MPIRGHAPAVGFVSLGCPKALVDSERLITELKTRGYAIAAGYADADLVAKVSTGLGDAMPGQEISSLGVHLAERGW